MELNHTSKINHYLDLEKLEKVKEDIPGLFDAVRQTTIIPAVIDIIINRINAHTFRKVRGSDQVRFSL